MTETRIRISSIIENQLPQFVVEEFPLVNEFLKQYYISLESKGQTLDILQNIDQYVKVDNLTNLIDSTVLTQDISFFDTTINVESTYGFPESYGLLSINSEIITYTSKTSTSFEGCIRGFSGVTSYNQKKDELTFSQSESKEHPSSTIVSNLNILFLKEFLFKIKKQITPGFEDRELYSQLDQRLFIKQSIDFYSSKGTENSFKILFKALYGKNVDVILPRDYVIRSSDADYRITSEVFVESIQGDPNQLLNRTLYQDDVGFIKSAKATVSYVEEVRVSNKTYYKLNLDYNYDRTVEVQSNTNRDFTVHPKTKVVSDIIFGSSTLEVDSTVSFPTSGNLLVNLPNGTTLNILYNSKTLNQFLNCSGIDQDIPDGTTISYNTYSYAYVNNDIVKVRILGVISDIEPQGNSILYSTKDVIRIKTLGINSKNLKANNWFFNIPVKYKIKSIYKKDSSDNSYKIEFYDEHYFNVGDNATLFSSVGDQENCYVYAFNNKKSIGVRLGSERPSLNENNTYIIRKNILKANSKNYSQVNEYTTNVQNVYEDSTDNSVYVTSPSIPSYSDNELKVTNRSVTFSGSFSGEDLDIGTHGLYTGDRVVYKSGLIDTLGINPGIYFIKKVDQTKIKLAKSKSDIFYNKFVEVNGDTTNSVIEIAELNYNNLISKNLDSQKLIRKISNPVNDIKEYETKPGCTGILVNGVEVCNYKSNDNVYYGPIENIAVLSSGSGYDVVNPPDLTITDINGYDAKSYCTVNGTLERIDIEDPGFDYLDTPKVTISGGNGNGASCEVKLTDFEHKIIFIANDSSNLVELNPTNTISFLDHHKLRDNEEVVYFTNGQQSIGGLSTSFTYYASVQDSYTIKLHKTYYDSLVGINTIQLTSYGKGEQYFVCKNKKRRVNSIIVTNNGAGYQNKYRSAQPSGISTFSSTVNIKNHGYLNGEIVVYNSSDNPIGGLSSSTSYYLTKVDEDNFKLSEIGISTLGVSSSFYYDTKQYIKFTNSGVGTHKFNYPPVSVSISGKIGVSTLSGLDCNSKLIPVFRGEIESIFVESGGFSYGSQEIINHDRQPTFTLNQGSGSQFTPIISNGKIVEVVVNSSGNNYKSQPNIVVKGSGYGAILTPIISNGSIVEIKVINGGYSYKASDTKISTVTSGSGAKFKASIKPWKINLVERFLHSSKISSDDGILIPSLNQNYGLEYAHAYAPRNLRSLVQATNYVNGEKRYTSDLQTIDNKETDSFSHSPIIGWSYDGNPIYGPYGFTTITGGSIRSLKSSYEILLKEGRPSTEIYPQGFFVDDYSYVGSGDLDEHNGRFCITPEYPNGVYAYFTTINDGPVEISGVFENYKKPKFPYVIGNSYKSKPIDFNFDPKSNQDNIDLNKTKWRRNTRLHGILNSNIEYGYINDLNLQDITSTVESVSVGSIDSINLISSGEDYRVGDKIIFEKVGDDNVFANVSLVKGKEITQISAATSSYDDVRFYPYGQNFVAFTTVPHNYLDNDLITVTGDFDYKKYGTIKVFSNTLKLESGVSSTSSTGIVTYFKVNGDLNFPNIKENDVYKIRDEEVKVLNIDKISSRIRVLRNYNNTVGITSYSAGEILTEKTKKFRTSFNISTSYNFDIDKEYYFDPKESVGIGTTSGVGIVSTLTISNPGVGITQISIPTKAIYIQNHELNTGDSLIYSSNGGTTLAVSTNGTSSFQLAEQSIVYAIKLSNDLIGISTNKVGLGSTGIFVSLGSTNYTDTSLYFTSVGSGNTHSFKTIYSNIFSARVDKNIVTVSTSSSHGLSLYDNVVVNINSGISTNIIVKYDDHNRRLIINPRTYSTIDTTTGTINLPNHDFYTGQKVLHTSQTPATGLENEKIYYVVVVDQNKIRLSNTYYQSIKQIPETVSITSSSVGSISKINPEIKLTKNQTVIFDLSDSSLGVENNIEKYSAFDFKIYKDSNFKHEFESSSASSSFEVTRSGKIGISSEAKVQIKFNSNTPEILYYNLVPTNLNILPEIKKEIYRDLEVNSSNRILLIDSKYSGSHTISGISSNTFQYPLVDFPESAVYTQDVEYSTSSREVIGPIDRIQISQTGKRYSKLVGITSISSEFGKSAVLRSNTTTIGNVRSSNIQNIGYEYSSDYTIRPLAKLPDLLILESLSSFEYIGITSFGKGYTITPNLVVVDSITNRIIDDVELSYSKEDTEVRIIKNSSKISSVTPKIIPINNSNGIKIKNINFNNNTKDVTVTLDVGFSSSDDFPFVEGGKVLIEGVSVGIATTFKGYNSSKYNYSLFTVTSVDANIGGIGATVTYNLSNYLEDGEFPGNFNSFYSSGRITPESYFPVFNPVLKTNTFLIDEKINSTSSSGFVQGWDPISKILKVSTSQDFAVGDIIRGNSSKSYGIIKEIKTYDVDYKINSYAFPRKEWKNQVGFLNNDNQRVHDNDYYQYFSYDLRSEISFDSWDNAVSTLNHTAGFKKFSNLIVESPTVGSGISTEQNNGDFVGIADLTSINDINCYQDFDLVTENYYNFDDSLNSDQILFNSRIVQDYIESIGNRVLMIDDISSKFNSNPRSTAFSIVDTFGLSEVRSKKYLICTIDKRFYDQKQLSSVSLIHNNSEGFLNQYGMDTFINLGFFDFSIFGTDGNLLFYPIKSRYNDYHIQVFSFSLSDITSGIGTVQLGDSVSIKTNTYTIPQGTSSSSSIVGIASTYRSAKVLVQIGSTTSSYYEYNEILYTHDGSNVYFLDYGEITTKNLTSQYSSGIGTYNAYISGEEIKIDIVPNTTTSTDYTVNTLVVSLGSTESSGIGTEFVGGSSMNSSVISIASTSSPTSSIIATYSNEEFNSSYNIISIEDKTNSEYQVSEFLSLTNTDDSYSTEFGIINTGSSLGITTIGISGTNTNIYFTPIENIDADVKVFQINLGLSEISNQLNII